MNEVVSVAPKKLIGLLRRGPSSFNDVEKSGSQFASDIWHEFVDLLLKHGFTLGQDLYGVSWPADDNTPPQEVHYFCGVESEAKISEFTSLKIDGGNYFEYRCEVPASNLDLAFQQAYLEAMPASGLIEREGQHIEVYGVEYDPNSPVAKFRILIPVV